MIALQSIGELGFVSGLTWQQQQEEKVASVYDAFYLTHFTPELPWKQRLEASGLRISDEIWDWLDLGRFIPIQKEAPSDLQVVLRSRRALLGGRNGMRSVSPACFLDFCQQHPGVMDERPMACVKPICKDRDGIRHYLCSFEGRLFLDSRPIIFVADIPYSIPLYLRCP